MDLGEALLSNAQLKRDDLEQATPLKYRVGLRQRGDGIVRAVAMPRQPDPRRTDAALGPLTQRSPDIADSLRIRHSTDPTTSLLPEISLVLDTDHFTGRRTQEWRVCCLDPNNQIRAMNLLATPGDAGFLEHIISFTQPGSVDDNQLVRTESELGLDIVPGRPW